MASLLKKAFQRGDHEKKKKMAEQQLATKLMQVLDSGATKPTHAKTDFAVGAVDAIPKQPLVGPYPNTAMKALRAEAKQSKDDFKIENWGYIVLDRKNERFDAHCGCIGEESEYLIECNWCPVRDHSTPTMPVCRMNRKGAKRPLGLLVAWLQQGVFWESHAKHLEGRVCITYEERVVGRAWLKGQPDLRPVLDAERAWSEFAASEADVEEPLISN